ncbi:dimethyl sulfoxide reductase anchor subunit family protein [Parendozoicomonas haliclonae]|uniref:Anaerobic dimethyl sulfoxide reductase chain C n=1 Tax=Parendozoicomonas haliclonae TaxID=1960125 RepID=A0A1X7AF64_9GAMM|nr:DmsC/YnfH family molybdoenzyme membrane anchor subunit [Parendozoicomonas haliclonae]SMA34365.1 Anaerobic dimethyl sulfoxide reductase chain C [Parendozoicomonas haliclonae]
MSQLSLVFFTVLAQSAVGLFISLGLVQLLARPNEKAMTRAFMAVLVMLGLGAISSVTHLGQPFRMFNVMFGLEHFSALSLEIVGLSLFGGAAGAYVGMRMFNILPKLQNLVLLGGMAAGILFILLIAQVYTLKTVPTWNSGWTSFQFLMTAFVVGPIAAIALLRAQAKELGDHVVKLSTNGLAVTNMIALAISMTGYVGYLFWLGQVSVFGNPFEHLGYGQLLGMLRTGLMMFAVMALSISTLRGGKSPVCGIVSLVAVLAAEIAGRMFFYDIYMSASAGM